MTPIAAEAITRAVLPTGLVVLARPLPGSGSVALSAYVRAGARFDDRRPGLSLFVGTALLHGTARRTARQIAEELDGMGASLAVTPGIEVHAVIGRSLPGDLPAILELTSEIFTQPAFVPDEVEKVRGRLITAARADALDTRYVAERLFRRLAYPSDHPHAQPPSGDEAVFAALTPDELRAFHASHYRPEVTLVAVAGDVDARRAVEQVSAAFGGWTTAGQAAGGGGTPFPAPPGAPDRVGPGSRRRAETAVPGKTQSDLVLGAPGITRGDPDYYAALMANLVLGRLGMMGRIGASVRERRGMAYYAYSDLRAGLLAGPWWVRAGVNPVNVDGAVAAILHEIRTLQQEGAAADELADARTFLVGSLALRLETNQGVAQALAEIELFGLGLDYLERYPAIIGAVTAEDILRAIRRFPIEEHTLAIAGPERT